MAQPHRRLDALLTHLPDAPPPVAARPAANRKHALPKGGGGVTAVTGAAGYVGSWLVKLLLARGHSVRACVRDVSNERKTAFLKAMPEYGTKLTLHSADMTKPGAYDEIFQGVQVVFHPAEVFMSFGDGRDKKGARKDFGPDRPTLEGLNKAAMSSSKYIVDSINKSKTVKRLIYTASIASLMPAFGEYNNRPIVDETREPDHRGGSHGYNLTKRAAEHYFAYEAAISHGRWSMITGNPADIVGPVLSPHQATETWQGKIGGIIQGIPSPQEGAGRPWMLVDVRDVAEAEIRLAESSDVESGERFLLSSSDKIYPEDIGPQVMALFPGYDSATTVAPGAGQKKVTRNHPVWQRVHLSHEKVTRAVGFNFHSFDDTLKATVKSLVDVGGIKPKMK